MEKNKIVERLSNRYFGDEVKVYEETRLEDKRDRDVFSREIEIVKKFLSDSINGPLLDVACGTGRVMPHYGKREISGIDISKDMLKIAKKRKPSAKLKVADATEIPYDDETFSVCITSRFLMHTPDYSIILREMARVTKKGGSIIADFPNKNSLSYFTTKYRLYRKIGDLKFFNLFSYSEIEKLAKKNNLKVMDIQAKTFLPAKILPVKFSNFTKFLNRFFVNLFPKISTPMYVRFVKIN